MAAVEEKPFPKEGQKYTRKSDARRAALKDGLIDGQYQYVEIGKEGDPSHGWAYKVRDSFKKMKSQFKESKGVTRPVNEPKRKRSKPEDEDDFEIDKELAEKTPEEIAAEKIEAEKKAMEVEAAAKKAEVPQVVKNVAHTLHEDDIPRAKLKVIDVAGGEKDPDEEASTVPLSVVSQTQDHRPGVTKSATSDKPSRVVKVVKGVVVNDGKLHKSKVESPTKAVWAIADEMYEKNPATTRKQVVEESVKRGIAFYTARTQYQQWLTKGESKQAAKARAAKAAPKK